MKVFEWLHLCLKAYGCSKVFGVPGSLIMPIWQNLPDLEIILCSHEQEASYVATGYAKMKNELVAVISTGGPGVTNCISGLAAANLDSIPMLYISGRTSTSHKNQGLRQEEGDMDRCYDSIEILKTITKLSTSPCNLEDTVLQIEECCIEAISGRPGCCHISIPVNLQSSEIGYRDVDDLYNRANAHMKSRRIFSYIHTTVSLGERPLIIMGWGCWLARVVDLVYEFADRMQIPVLVTSKGSCCIKNSEVFLGKLGYGYNPILESFVKKYAPTTVFAFGTSMSKKDVTDEFLGVLNGAKIHVFTLETDKTKVHLPQAVWHETNQLDAVIAAFMQGANREKSEALLQEIQLCRSAQEEYYLHYLGKDDLMANVIISLNSIVTRDTVVTADAGNHLVNTAVLFAPEINDANLVLDDGIRAMGSGICETVGMAIAQPTQKFLAITGDGCMLMNGNVMYLAARRNLPILFLVIVNSSLGRVRIGQMRMNQVIASNLGDIDFCMYAKSFGLSSFEADNAQICQDFVAQFLKNPTPTLVACHTGIDEIPIALKAKGVWN